MDAQLSPTTFLKFISTRLFLLLLPPRRLRVLLRPPRVDAPVHQRAFSRGRAAAGKPRVHTEIFHVCLPVPTREIAFHAGDLRLTARRAGRQGRCWVSRSAPPKARQTAGAISNHPTLNPSQQHSSLVSHSTSMLPAQGWSRLQRDTRRDEPAETAAAFLQDTANTRTPLRSDTRGGKRRQSPYRSPYANRTSA